MAQHDWIVSIRQMRDHAREAVALAQGHDLEDLAENRVLELALTRLAEIVGEAARRVPSKMQDNHADIPWALAIGFRNILAHGYDNVELPILWATITEDFPLLITSLDAVLD